MFVFLQYLLPQHLLSRLVGFFANCRYAPLKNALVKAAIWRFDIDLTEAVSEDINDYATFNDFFTRALQPGARPVAGRFCSPADGTVSACGPIEAGMLLQAKGIHYSLGKLLGDTTSRAFENGSFITIYLSPRDYHRVHVPAAGELASARYLPGKLFSVNEATTQSVRDLFAINERLVTEFQGSDDYCLIMVGALIVAAIQPVWRDAPYPARQHVAEHPVLSVEQGDELGRFRMGSTAILLTRERVDWQVAAGDTVRLGQALV